MEKFVIQVPNNKIAQVKQFLMDLGVRIKPDSKVPEADRKTSYAHSVKPVGEEGRGEALSSFDETAGLTLIGFEAWADEWKDEPKENKLWEEFYKKQKRVSAG